MIENKNDNDANVPETDISETILTPMRVVNDEELPYFERVRKLFARLFPGL